MKHPAYHLRIHKSVDRLLLVDLIRQLAYKEKDCIYYSLAGPFLEDLRVIDHFFPDMQLVSFENNDETYKRQIFHQFSKKLDIRFGSIENFLSQEYPPDNLPKRQKHIFWLDYTSLLFEHFTVLQQLLRKVPSGSVLRITVRAEHDIDFSLIKDQLTAEEYTRIKEKFSQRFRSRFEKVLPTDMEINVDAKIPEYSKLVQRMIKRAVQQVFPDNSHERIFIHVHSTRYIDHTNMISVTGVVCDYQDIKKTRKALEGRRLINFDWGDPVEIVVPALTVKERLYLERFLPDQETAVGSVLFTKLGYCIDRDNDITIQQLQNYAEYHREYPNFVRILA